MTARGVALGLGIGFALLTVAELALGQVSLAGTDVLLRTTKANLVHWTVALVSLGASFGGHRAAVIALRVVGPALAVLAVWGMAAPSALGGFLGYPNGIPAAYNAYHAIGAAIALFVAFSRARAKG